MFQKIYELELYSGEIYLSWWFPSMVGEWIELYSPELRQCTAEIKNPDRKWWKFWIPRTVEVLVDLYVEDTYHSYSSLRSRDVKRISETFVKLSDKQ